MGDLNVSLAQLLSSAGRLALASAASADGAAHTPSPPAPKRAAGGGRGEDVGSVAAQGPVDVAHVFMQIIRFVVMIS